MTYNTHPQGRPQAQASIAVVSLSADASFTSGNTVPLDTVTSSHPLTTGVSVSSNIVTLGAGDYVIFGAVALQRSSATAVYTVDFYNSATSTLLPVVGGWMGAKSIETNASDSQVLHASVHIGAPSISFYLQCSGASGTVKADGTYLIILEL